MNLARTMFLSFVVAIGCGQGTLGLGVALADDSTDEARSGLRVGVFDSRALAIAFVPSKFFQDWMKPLMEEYEKAKSAGDEEKISELEAQGEAQQARLHEQGFSTGRVDNILECFQTAVVHIRKSDGDVTQGRGFKRTDMSRVFCYCKASNL